MQFTLGKVDNGRRNHKDSVEKVKKTMLEINKRDYKDEEISAALNAVFKSVAELSDAQTGYSLTVPRFGQFRQIEKNRNYQVNQVTNALLKFDFQKQENLSRENLMYLPKHRKVLYDSMGLHPVRFSAKEMAMERFTFDFAGNDLIALVHKDTQLWIPYLLYIWIYKKFLARKALFSNFEVQRFEDKFGGSYVLDVYYNAKDGHPTLDTKMKMPRKGDILLYENGSKWKVVRRHRKAPLESWSRYDLENVDSGRLRTQVNVISGKWLPYKEL